MKNRINGSVLVSCILILSLAATPVLAEFHPDPTSPKGRTISTGPRYTPPPDQPMPRGNTTSTGTRGGGKCESSKGPALTILAPQKYVGRTASTHPTFAWFVPDSKPLPLEFAIYEYGPDNKLKQFQKLELNTTPGIMRLTLPEDKPGLTVGQRYLWQVIIFCNPKHPSTAVVAKAEIETVEITPALQMALSATRDPLEKADLYARSSLWYDALIEALGNPEDSRLRGFASNLLEDLASLENSKQSANLRKIAGRV